MIYVAIVEDDARIRQDLKNRFQHEGEFECLCCSDSVESMLEYLKKHTIHPDIILMDIGLPGRNGIEGARLIKAHYPDIEIAMLTVYSDSRNIFEALRAGASGYLLKSAPFEEVKKAIQTLVNGGSAMTPVIARKVIEYFHPSGKKHASPILTEREQEVVQGLVDGLSYKMIADRMNISIGTVFTYIKNIYKKLHVHSKAEVISKSLKGEL
ncbi:MAG: response regulator transcription factor [Calditrichia bacterium]